MIGVPNEQGRLTKEEVCKRAGIKPGYFYHLRQGGLVPGPVAWPRFGGRGSVAYYDPSVVERIHKIREMREKGWSKDQMRAHLVWLEGLRDDKAETLFGVEAGLSRNPGLDRAVNEMERRVREVYGEPFPGLPVWVVVRRGKGWGLVFGGFAEGEGARGLLI